MITISGHDNTVGMPVYLPELNPANRVCVNETTGGTVTIPEAPGFALTIAPCSATFPGGSRSGCVSVTPVNMDKVPMSPGFGQQPRFIVTIQPVGTHFNPPARMTIPNVDGLAPRAVTEMYSYDHDLASFVAIGSATVSQDGSTIMSDIGAGVVKAGWHCGGNPSTTGSAGTCPTCKKCEGANCVADNGQSAPQASPTDCKEQFCNGGSVESRNKDSEKPTRTAKSAKMEPLPLWPVRFQIRTTSSVAASRAIRSLTSLLLTTFLHRNAGARNDGRAAAHPRHDAARRDPYPAC